MAVRIRLSRGGSKKRPFYRIVAADQRAPRDGRFIEKLGTYNPLLPKDSAERLVVDAEKVKSWISKVLNRPKDCKSFLLIWVCALLRLCAISQRNLLLKQKP